MAFVPLPFVRPSPADRLRDAEHLAMRLAPSEVLDLAIATAIATAINPALIVVFAQQYGEGKRKHYWTRWEPVPSRIHKVFAMA